MKIPHDKQLHFGAGFAVAIVGSLAFGPAAGLILGVTAGALKEMRDYICYGGPDVYDFLATAAGAAVGAGIAMIL